LPAEELPLGHVWVVEALHLRVGYALTVRFATVAFFARKPRAEDTGCEGALSV
jgi:hypothetical protein